MNAQDQGYDPVIDSIWFPLYPDVNDDSFLTVADLDAVVGFIDSSSNTSPHAFDNSFSLSETGGSVWATGFDFQADALAINIRDDVDNGTLAFSSAVQENGRTTFFYNYTPNAGFTGTDEFQFEVSEVIDGTATRNISTVWIDNYGSDTGGSGGTGTGFVTASASETIVDEGQAFVLSGTSSGPVAISGHWTMMSQPAFQRDRNPGQCKRRS